MLQIMLVACLLVVACLRSVTFKAGAFVVDDATSIVVMRIRGG